MLSCLEGVVAALGLGKVEMELVEFGVPALYHSKSRGCACLKLTRARRHFGTARRMIQNPDE